ncbi:MAG: HlyD family efflux transporter periplasmic adaptor subunit [Symploca sp. SIO3C6]|uniref:HlyD family efflux transporter periplasmic adaptor subunit n=1 Tax=Symploca sp. SIO1C4 TaxID=2607765 RepID=A0A6B3NCH2_9CYAN|nr:HlyD family efflux transporter periplasmic adaptor subunit [Symploca sp. SIO3C6]NER29367.1 HlyD family efflux transporter periplasmic adaptor subunit [Symploca sp. SIO1C4]
MTSQSQDTLNTENSSQITILPVEATRLNPVESYQVSRNYTGEVASFRASEIGFGRTGRLIWLGFDRGDKVSAGTPLAKLDIINFEAQLLQLIAQKDQAVALLKELQAGPRTERIAAARASVKDLEELLALEGIRRSRREYLYTEGAISKEQLDEVAFNANALSERLQAAKSNLDELLNGTRSEQIEAQKAVVRQLEARISDLEITIGKSTIKAPFDATISARHLDEGTFVDPGQSVFRLVEDAKPEVEIGIPVQGISQLQPGSQQQVQIGGKTYQAQVSSILPEVDPATRTRTAVLDLEPSAASSVAPGQVARLEIAQTIATKGYWLPATALVRGDRGLWSCYALVEVEKSQDASITLSENVTKTYRVERRDVEVLHTHSDTSNGLSQRVLVRGTLRAGDSVIINGTQRIVPGQLVRLADS